MLGTDVYTLLAWYRLLRRGRRSSRRLAAAGPAHPPPSGSTTQRWTAISKYGACRARERRPAGRGVAGRPVGGVARRVGRCPASSPSRTVRGSSCPMSTRIRRWPVHRSRWRGRTTRSGLDGRWHGLKTGIRPKHRTIGDGVQQGWLWLALDGRSATGLDAGGVRGRWPGQAGLGAGRLRRSADRRQQPWPPRCPGGAAAARWGSDGDRALDFKHEDASMDARGRERGGHVARGRRAQRRRCPFDNGPRLHTVDPRTRPD